MNSTDYAILAIALTLIAGALVALFLNSAGGDNHNPGCGCDNHRDMDRRFDWTGDDLEDK
jgi:hypothetical protein